MKVKFIWATVAVLIITALLLTACGGGNGGPTPGPYGGTLTTRRAEYTAQGYNPVKWDAYAMLSIIFDRYLTVPWEKGQADGGTGEYTFQSTWYPQSDYRGEYYESWDQPDLYTCHFVLRQGITYWDKAPVNGRNMTVDDIIWNGLRMAFHEDCDTYLRSTPESALSWWSNLMDETGPAGSPTNSTARDRLVAHLAELQTVTTEMEAYWAFEGTLLDFMETNYWESYDLLEANGYDVEDIALLGSYTTKIDDYHMTSKHARGSQSLWNAGNGVWPTPKEVTEVDEFNDWETVVATGPWIPQTFIPESEASFIRNPDYWQNDPINTENQLPYLDEWVILIIADESLYYSGLQTKLIDLGTVEWYLVDDFKTSYPEMSNLPWVNGWTHCIFVRNDDGPFSDVRVRQAAMLAIDHDEFMDHYDGYAIRFCWPEQEYIGPAFTPLNEFPQATQDLFGPQDIPTAQALLTAAGYENGFTTDLYVYPSTEDRESCQIAQAYLAEVGINATIEDPDAATYLSVLYGREYEWMISCWYDDNFPGDAMAWGNGGAMASPYNFGNTYDQLLVDTTRATELTLDATLRYGLIKEANKNIVNNMYQILLPTPVGNTFAWPWVKNYHFEADLGWPDGSAWGEIPKYLQIDEELKESMS